MAQHLVLMQKKLDLGDRDQTIGAASRRQLGGIECFEALAKFAQLHILDIQRVKRVVAQLGVDIRKLRIEARAAEIGRHDRKLTHEKHDVLVLEGRELRVRIGRRRSRRRLFSARCQRHRQQAEHPACATSHRFTAAGCPPTPGGFTGRVCWNDGRRSRRSNHSRSSG